MRHNIQLWNPQKCIHNGISCNKVLVKHYGKEYEGILVATGPKRRCFVNESYCDDRDTEGKQQNTDKNIHIALTALNEIEATNRLQLCDITIHENNVNSGLSTTPVQ
ncbi:unnamed protein product [Didymodactylos carnosus]|uniref:Uncharacterized protein n=1 Tax=Didymodactylos carnosus TaxID=1234261 RepID=A0A8S2EXA8_9BILA|nr:unnamed protein product [Didymodactylos carnosus]CAF4070271.1 unnamed protein product [Didymodactylos carnosus]